MAKNIVLCSDGTGNRGVKGRGTNVYKIYEAVDVNSHRHDSSKTEQIAFYDDGVGTETFKLLKIFGGAFGWGLSNNVKDLYIDLVRVYNPGDRIFLFGFSRGAFTVRTLAGFILDCGIIDWEQYSDDAGLDRLVKQAYKSYRWKYRAILQRLWNWIRPRQKPDNEEDNSASRFRAKFAVKDAPHALDGKVKIAFIGVWDTVDAVGLPFRELASVLNYFFYQFKFENTRLSGRVERVCHALSIDDERRTFHPLLWNEEDKNCPRIEQVWFPGVHSNVGGGYPKQGMSLVALDWMMSKASDENLEFIEHDRTLYHERRNVDDKLYDPRSGVKVFYRYQPRDIGKISKDNGIKEMKIHISTARRISNGTLGYAPGGYPANATLVMTGEPCERTKEKLADLQSAVGENLGSNSSPLDLVRLEIRSRVALHFSFVILTIMTVLLTVGSRIKADIEESDNASFIGIVKSTFRVSRDFVSALGDFNWVGGFVYIVETFKSNPWIPVFLIIIFGLTVYLRKRTQRKLSEFWHPLQKKIKKALNELKEA